MIFFTLQDLHKFIIYFNYHWETRISTTSYTIF